jgi:cell division protein FtsL
MNRRITKFSPQANRAMAAPVKRQPVQTAPTKPNAKSGARKNKASPPILPKAEFNAAAIKRSLSLLFPFAVFLFLGLFLIWERVKVRELAAQIAKLDAQRNQLVDQNGKLRIQLEQLSGYGRIARIATQRLGLVAVPQQAIIVEE